MRLLELLGPSGFNINQRDFTEGLARDLHEKGKTVAVYTVNDPGEMRELIRAGVDALINDRPDVGIEISAPEGR